MLYEKLADYAKSDIYPFHMPGHKRRKIAEFLPYEIDITEIDGFDNLHHAKEILKEVQQKAAELYGSKDCFYLINGSTCGILASISAVVNGNEKILVARNCHKSVYHGLFLRQLQAEYLYPVETTFGIQGQITKEQVEQKLIEQPDIKAVLLTSPTYDGVVSDIEKIAQVVHKYHIPLIVDSAHGAHFGFSKGFPENVVKLGADIVIESVHKTLPAFTQTALLHVCSERVSLEKIKRYLSIYETSSPSYILMAGIDNCVEFLKKEKAMYLECRTNKSSLQMCKALSDGYGRFWDQLEMENLQITSSEPAGECLLYQFEKHLEWFYQEVSGLKHLHILQKSDLSKEEAFDFDESKILIFSKNRTLSGADLQHILLEEYGLQMEMACGNYTLALSTIMDTKEGFERLAKALLEIDEILEYRASYEKTNMQNSIEKTDEQVANADCESSFYKSVYKMQKKCMEIFEAQEQKNVSVLLEEAVGNISADYIYLYPPGIPIIVPGEEITKSFIEDIRYCQEKGLEVEGLSNDGKIMVVVSSNLCT